MRKSWIVAFAAPALAAAGLLFVQSTRAADHLDAPGSTADPAADINDVYVFRSKDPAAGTTKRTVFVMTGNNVQLGGDLPRRVIPIEIDPKVENPEDRRDFRYPNLLAHARAERPRLAAAALTVLRAYVVAGRPQHDKPAKGSYEDWDRLVRGAIIWAGGADPLGGVETLRKRGSVDSNELRELLAAWVEAFGPVSVTVSRALEKAGTSGLLFDAIAAYGRGKPVDARMLGTRLAKLRGRIVDGRCFHEDGIAHGGSRLWRVGAP